MSRADRKRRSHAVARHNIAVTAALSPPAWCQPPSLPPPILGVDRSSSTWSWNYITRELDIDDYWRRWRCRLSISDLSLLTNDREERRGRLSNPPPHNNKKLDTNFVLWYFFLLLSFHFFQDQPIVGLQPVFCDGVAVWSFDYRPTIAIRTAFDHSLVDDVW